VRVVKIVGLIALVVVLAGFAYGGYSVYQLCGRHQRDLGVKPTAADYQRAVAKKAGVDVARPSELYVGAAFSARGAHHVDQVFTDAELSAIVNQPNAAKGIIGNVQIRALGDNQAEASFVVDLTKLTSVKVPVIGGFLPSELPVYVRGTAAVTGPRSISADVVELRAGNLVVPGWIVGRAQQRFVDWLNGQLAKVDGLSTEKAEILKGRGHFVGTLPDAITAR